MKTGIELIAEERARQVAKEGWTPAHDDEHDDGALAQAAACYAIAAHYDAAHKRFLRRELLKPNAFVPPTLIDQMWPGWDPKWFKPDTPMRDLVRAGALIAAEIDRLQRWQQNEQITSEPNA